MSTKIRGPLILGLPLPFVLAGLAATAFPQKGRVASGRGTFQKVLVTDPGFEDMYYTVFVPKGTKPRRRYPLVVALHGNGQKSDGHARNMAKVSTEERPVFVVAPQYQRYRPNGYEFNNPVYPKVGTQLRKILMRDESYYDD